jgi:prenyltransferase beta subunit
MRRTLFAGLCLFVAVLPLRGQTPDQKKATVEYLQKLQQKDGGFVPAAGQTKASLRATSSALRALKHFGGEPKEEAACADFVKSCIDKDSGGFADAPGGKPDVALTAVGVMAAVEVKLPPDLYEAGALKYLGENAKSFDDIRIAAAGVEALGKKPPQADAWLEQVLKMRNDDGTWGKGDGQARDTGGAVVVVLRLGGKVEKPEAVLKALKDGQRADGGFGKADTDKSDLESTYRIMRAFHMLKAPPADVGRLRDLIAGCRNDDGGYGVGKGQPSTVSGTYYAGTILHWLDEK